MRADDSLSADARELEPDRALRPIPPANLDAERAVLASMILDPDAAPAALEIVTPEKFYSVPHRLICHAIVRLIGRAEPVDLITLKEELRRLGKLEAVGGADFLQSILDAVPVTSNVKHHAKIVRDAAVLRALIAASSRITETAYAAATDPGEILRRAESDEEMRPVFAALGEVMDSTGQQRVIEYVDVDADEEIEPIPWLLPGWLAADDVAMIAGAPYAGKSTLAYDLADALARGRPWCGITPTRQVRVLIVDEQMGQRASKRMARRVAKAHGGRNPNRRLVSMQGFCFNTPEGIARIERTIREFRPEGVILDGMLEVFGVEDENDSAEAMRIYRSQVFRLRDLYGVCFILIHHKKKTQGQITQELIELVRGSSAHGGACSTIWYMSRNGDESADLRQAKRRECQPLAMRIGYREDGTDGPIYLTGEGSIEQADTQIEKCTAWLLGFVGDRGSVKAGDIKSAARLEGYSPKTIKTAMRIMSRAGSLQKPARGLYRCPRGTFEGPSRDQEGPEQESAKRLEASGGAHLEAPRALAVVGPSRDLTGTQGEL